MFKLFRKRIKFSFILIGALGAMLYGLIRTTSSFSATPTSSKGAVQVVRFSPSSVTRLDEPQHPNQEKSKNEPSYDLVIPSNEFSLEKAQLRDGQYVQILSNGDEVTYTIIPELQEAILKVYKAYDLPSAAFVAIDPKTGEVLAMVSYSQSEQNHKNLALEPFAHAASVFKMITAAALLDKKLVHPGYHVCFHGGANGISKNNLVDNDKYDKTCETFAMALGKSTNAAIAKLAYRYLSPKILQKYADRFGFNMPIHFEFPVSISIADIPNDKVQMAIYSVGFSSINMSPLHGCLMAASIANNGVMMQPKIIRSYKKDGKIIYSLRPSILKRVLQDQVAQVLGQMLLTTTTHGTALKYFRNRSPILSDIDIAGKTGSLTSRNGDGLHFTWFVGFASLNHPQIAVASVVANSGKWKIKATYVVKEALETYYRLMALKSGQQLQNAKSK